MRATVAGLADEVLDWRFKAIPASAWGRTVAEFLATGPRLSDLGTPALTLDARALDFNLATMAGYCAAAGVELAPHGKTTMAPALWERQIAAGAWGITLANVPQLRVGRAFGVRRLQLANALVDPGGLRWIADELDADPDFSFVSWADSTDTVELMDAVLRAHGARRPLDVLVEVGHPGARTGVRDLDEAVRIAQAVAAAPTLRLAGVAGYEGVVAHEATPGDLDAVAAYLRTLADLHTRLADAGLYDPSAEIIVTAGGSSFFDQVVEVLGPLAGPGVRVLLRSGAYIVHDDGFYRGISPFSRGVGSSPLISAMHGWVRVLSRPEPELALLDGGKRDLPFDDAMPTPQYANGEAGPVAGAVATAVADQHTFLRLDPASSLRVGDVVRLGLSHPCTAMDKWSLIPVLDDASSPDPLVVDLIRTFF
ncbi:alanine racemase [Actinospica durhamensis]|uniref:Alanine racemase n=1 Tax=Actinospica durhamensis TaxID=1508375 RepID=A0A941IT04_9ACTN|nr:alanine racemase [Actinospica durhamensis]MBR7837027.1 alanine racemase [Actinospica durhamensis]